MALDREKSFTESVISVIKKIPKGKISTYGQIAAMAGSPRAARQVVRILHTCSKKENLPWHRVVNKEGKIVLKEGSGFELQKQLLLKEKIKFKLDGSIDLDKHLWMR